MIEDRSNWRTHLSSYSTGDDLVDIHHNSLKSIHCMFIGTFVSPRVHGALPHTSGAKVWFVPPVSVAMDGPILSRILCSLMPISQLFGEKVALLILWGDFQCIWDRVSLDSRAVLHAYIRRTGQGRTKFWDCKLGRPSYSAPRLPQGPPIFSSNIKIICIWLSHGGGLM
jgi:hypothetical protein